ncbi:Uncharacterised protein [Vibrio cholerae]|nr:Uncharacterised protein [Vibrio cholerae]CSC13220.1 Uncharacterised protein [Vibrio cholerae]CSC74202.1 Uncharacterised protein [Vibrio cholerae]CSI78684.1 Uncharacterised protein [Vibrio cholerae]
MALYLIHNEITVSRQRPTIWDHADIICRQLMPDAPNRRLGRTAQRDQPRRI